MAHSAPHPAKLWVPVRCHSRRGLWAATGAGLLLVLPSLGAQSRLSPSDNRQNPFLTQPPQPSPAANGESAQRRQGLPIPNAAMPSTSVQSWSKRGYPGESSLFPARGIFLNGVDISTLREQNLQNVDLRIDAQGNVLITARHYEVMQDPSWHPLMPTELPQFPRGIPTPAEVPPWTKDTSLRQGVPVGAGAGTGANVPPERAPLVTGSGDPALPPSPPRAALPQIPPSGESNGGGPGAVPPPSIPTPAKTGP